jgi:phage shock protein A
MALLERVTTLIRANLNDLIEKAENPEKLLKQLLLDMQNQFMQVKTQVAMAIADQHLLEKKQKESMNSQREWLRKAELAMAKGEEGLTRTALERSLAYENAARGFAQQVEEQSHQVQLLRDAMQRLDHKMTETTGGRNWRSEQGSSRGLSFALTPYSSGRKPKWMKRIPEQRGSWRQRRLIRAGNWRQWTETQT